MVLCSRCFEKIALDEVLTTIAASRTKQLEEVLRELRVQKLSAKKHKEVNQSLHAPEECGRTKERSTQQPLKNVAAGIGEARETKNQPEGEVTGEEPREKGAGKKQISTLKANRAGEGLTTDVLVASLSEYAERGDLDYQGEEIKVTPKGARKLARQILRRVIEKLQGASVGSHPTAEIGWGGIQAPERRSYEIGDEYYRVDCEGTLLNALVRLSARATVPLLLQPEDFVVYEEMHQTRIFCGLIIDVSGSMLGGRVIGGRLLAQRVVGEKIFAAIRAALALAELIRKEPQDQLRIYLFSHEVREVSDYDLLNAKFYGGTTDIKSALQAFQKVAVKEKGDKQAYLITDTEPNTENGEYIGFRRAIPGVLEEARRYKEAGITLNVIMLDERPELKELAATLARRNLGRVIFTLPPQLGEVLIKDFLAFKHGSRRGSFPFSSEGFASASHGLLFPPPPR